MEQEKRLAPKSQYESGKKEYKIHSIHYVQKAEDGEKSIGMIGRKKFYQQGVAPNEVKTGIGMDKERGKEQPHNERREGNPKRYMGTKDSHTQRVTLDAIPTKHATYILSRIERREGNVVYLRNPSTSDAEITEQPMLKPLNYDNWRKAGEDNPSSLFSENRGYELPSAEIGKEEPLNHVEGKDTPLRLKVRKVTPAPNMDLKRLGYALSREAENDTTYDHKSLDHYVRALRLKYAPPANDEEGGEHTETEGKKPSFYERFRANMRHFWGLEKVGGPAVKGLEAVVAANDPSHQKAA